MFNTLKLLIPIITVLFIACNNTIIQIPKPCTEESVIPFEKFSLRLITDVTSVNILKIYNKSVVTGNDIRIVKNGYSKSAKISAYICKNQEFVVNAVYNDTTDNSGLRIEGNLQNNWINGKILYCPDVSNCNYIQIGNILGQYVSYSGQGSFYTPMVSGQFFCGPAK